MRLYVHDLTATDAAEPTGLLLRSTNAIYQRIRTSMAQACAAQSPFTGELELDEFHFGSKRIRDKRGRGADDKFILLGLLKRGNCVYTEIVPDAIKEIFYPLCVEKSTLTAFPKGLMAWL